MTELKLNINGVDHDLDVPESLTLAALLRQELGLTGTKIGCDEAECGICTVHVDGIPVDSCIYPAFKAQGRSVRTVEGLACRAASDEEQLHPLQREFINHCAVQCGFCTPGLMMTAAALLDENPEPEDRDIKVALKDTYCRCTGYTSVLRAIHSAGRVMRGEEPLPPGEPEVVTPLKSIGHSELVPDIVDRVTGRAKYTDDYSFPGMVFARTLRSAHPHAIVRHIDTSRARALPGVLAVLTRADVPGENAHGIVTLDWPVLVGENEIARYTGDAIALVAAETAGIAEQALKLVDVDYEPLPVVADPVYAHSPDAPLVHAGREGGNLLKHIKVRHGDLQRGFDEADVVVERTYRTPIIEHAFLEPECAIGVPPGLDDEHQKLTIYVGSQIPYQDRNQVARAMDLPDEQVRVRGTLIGGGFGGKEDIAGQIHVAMLADALQRPVKLLYSRQESLLFHPKRHATVIRIRTGARRDGRLTAVEAELYGDGGAYASLSDKVMTRATTHATGPYDVPHAKIDCYAMYTNNPPAGAFRGFGVTQSAFAVEQNMDLIAEELGMDPIELRHINAQKVGVVTATGQKLRDSVGLLETIRICDEDLRGKVNGNFRWGWREGDLAWGWGVACAYKNTGLGGGAPDKSAAEVEAFDDGTVEVRTSSADMGQGLVAVLAQCAAEELGLPYRQVRVLLSDTDLTPDGGPTTASRQTFMSGNAVRHAAIGLRDALSSVLSEEHDRPPDLLRFEEGLVRVNGSSVSFGDAVRLARSQGIPTRIQHEYWGPKTQPLGTGGDMHFAFSYATQIALVSVDINTGVVHCEKIISATDVGRAINPMLLQGQIEGGIVMALGNALTESFIVEDGVPWSTLLARYKMPSIKHTPEIVSHLVEDPAIEGPYGAKGVGEIPSINTMPAITNAIYNAVGVRVFSLPVDQDALLLALRRGETEVHSAWHDVRETKQRV
ncbi:MAG: molybdopterin-dependent oxidoreductase [Anaerolineaceae bacterium]|nr:molybdopterin-dependent oxidoreductase [Anaerolineaceae bacterium]